MKNKLMRYVRDVPDFPKPGILFKDISPLLKNTEAMNTVIDLMATEWIGKVDSIAGLDARGFIFGSLLASRMQLPFVMIRKTGKLPGKTLSISYELEYSSASLDVQEDAFSAGSRVLIVDDLLATGGTASAACSLVEKAGAIVAGCSFIIELPQLGGRKPLEKYKTQSIISY